MSSTLFLFASTWISPEADAHENGVYHGDGFDVSIPFGWEQSLVPESSNTRLPGVRFQDAAGEAEILIRTEPTFTMGVGGLKGIYPSVDAFGAQELRRLSTFKLVRAGEISGAYFAEFRSVYRFAFTVSL
eukprot:gene13906-16437_t